MFSFRVLGQVFGVSCTDPELGELIRANWARMESCRAQPATVFTISKEPSGAISLLRPGRPLLWLADSGELLHQVECEVVVGLQERRPDLYFVHAAAVEYRGAAQLFVAESGAGKSTTVWALLHHGFRYLSDELSPIDVARMEVHAYPHALCLKRSPPVPYVLPAETFHTSRTAHVPVASLPLTAMADAYPLAALWFLAYDPSARGPLVHAITPAEASARLYANALNQLAHPNAGLDAAVKIARSIPSFVLASADLTATCELICSTITPT